jgi:group I intron endonuclease
MLIICIYKITNPTGRVYIGQTINYTNRMRAYRNGHCKTQRRVYNSFLSHGYENHKFEIVEKCEESQLVERERYWIEFYDSCNNGMNLNYGGASYRMLDETKKLMSIRRKLNPTGVVGNKGENHYNWGKKATEVQRQRLSEAKKGKCSGAKSNSFKGYVDAYRSGVFIGRYEGVVAAAKALNLCTTNISKVILGKGKQASGYTFKRDTV